MLVRMNSTRKMISTVPGLVVSFFLRVFFRAAMGFTSWSGFAAAMGCKGQRKDGSCGARALPLSLKAWRAVSNDIGPAARAAVGTVGGEAVVGRTRACGGVRPAGIASLIARLGAWGNHFHKQQYG